MDIKIRCSVCGLLMIIDEVSSSKANSAIVMHVSPCPCSSRPTTGAVDLGDSAALEVVQRPEVLSAGQADTTPAPNH
jgi:hypothetical protein